MKERVTGEVVSRGKPLATRTAESGSYTYVGHATVGASTAAAVWQIKRITDTGVGFTIEWANGDSKFDNVWDDRGGLSYA
jgi:hypothetical protein